MLHEVRLEEASGVSDVATAKGESRCTWQDLDEPGAHLTSVACTLTAEL